MASLIAPVLRLNIALDAAELNDAFNGEAVIWMAYCPYLECLDPSQLVSVERVQIVCA